MYIYFATHLRKKKPNNYTPINNNIQAKTEDIKVTPSPSPLHRLSINLNRLPINLKRFSKVPSSSSQSINVNMTGSIDHEDRKSKVEFVEMM